ncbi:MAG TPA: LysR family transcriptional regulator [Lactobacillus sp.]|nr:LysR family transcriptional regulator [Lactobacillus sp.]
METQKLQAFITVAATRSYTEAAERLYTTQATVSKQILSLEKEWGVTLFSRAHHQVQLTTMGKTLLPKAQAVVTAANDLNVSIAKQDESLKLMTIPSISGYRAFNQIASYHHLHPEVNLQMTEIENDAVDNALKNDTADIVFTRLFNQPSMNVESCVSETDEFCVVLPKKSALAGKTTLQAIDLANSDLLLLGESTYTYQPIQQLFDEAKIAPKVTYKGQRIDLILGMISRGFGLSIMMKKTVDLTDFPDLTTIKLVPTVSSQLAFLRKSGRHSHASDSFWNFIQQK